MRHLDERPVLFQVPIPQQWKREPGFSNELTLNAPMRAELVSVLATLTIGWGIRDFLHRHLFKFVKRLLALGLEVLEFLGGERALFGLSDRLDDHGWLAIDNT
jgi:hypothetical protein